LGSKVELSLVYGAKKYTYQHFFLVFFGPLNVYVIEYDENNTDGDDLHTRKYDPNK
jgi:hypothetical protein